MRSPLVAKIDEATKVAWPEVSAALAATTRSLHELAGISEDVVPLVEEYVANNPRGKLRRRKVCEEAIWVLAKLGWLRTGQERDVILAAKNWFDVTEAPDASDDEVVMAEDSLVDAIKSLPEHVDATQEAS